MLRHAAVDGEAGDAARLAGLLKDLLKIKVHIRPQTGLPDLAFSMSKKQVLAFFKFVGLEIFYIK